MFEFWKYIVGVFDWFEIVLWDLFEMFYDYWLQCIGKIFVMFLFEIDVYFVVLYFCKYEQYGFVILSGKVELKLMVFEDFGFDLLFYFWEDLFEDLDYLLKFFIGVCEDGFFQIGY